MFHSKKLPWPALALVLFLTAGPALALETAERTETVNATLSGGGALRVENLLGSVLVRVGRDANRVQIEAQVVAEAKTRQQADELVDSIELVQTVENGETRVHVRYPVERHAAFRPPKKGLKSKLARWAAPILRRDPSSVEYDGRAVQVGPTRDATAVATHLVVTLPLDVESTISQAVGAIRARSLRGRMRLEMVDGEVVVGQLFGGLEVETGSGKVEVSSFQGDDLEIQAASASIELLEVRAKRARLQTTDGAIGGTNVEADELHIESQSGGVRLVGVEPARAEIETGSGRVDLATRLRRTREAVVRSASGDVTLRVGELSHFDLLAETKSGSVKTMGLELDLVGREAGMTRLRNAGGGADVQVAAPGGSLTVRPYDATRLEILLRNRGG